MMIMSFVSDRHILWNVIAYNCPDEVLKHSSWTEYLKTKLEPPKLHFKLRAKRKNSYNSINIIIPKEYKRVIHDELKQLGIHRAFLFPEIDKVAQIVTNEYKIKKRVITVEDDFI